MEKSRPGFLSSLLPRPSWSYHAYHDMPSPFAHILSDSQTVRAPRRAVAHDVFETQTCKGAHICICIIWTLQRVFSAAPGTVGSIVAIKGDFAVRDLASLEDFYLTGAS